MSGIRRGNPPKMKYGSCISGTVYIIVHQFPEWRLRYDDVRDVIALKVGNLISKPPLVAVHYNVFPGSCRLVYISLDVTETKSCSHPYIIDRLTGDNNVTVPVNLQ